MVASQDVDSTRMIDHKYVHGLDEEIRRKVREDFTTRSRDNRDKKSNETFDDTYYKIFVSPAPKSGSILSRDQSLAFTMGDRSRSTPSHEDVHSCSRLLNHMR